ncbi:unnamed protein product [Rhizoctonia solani]|uniref:PepSY domain-containing protein n=1 Tax=Rhizoctonia solani TaxID=456999 RepID=A0A8H3C9Z1_9AGAM|nr:unnamed protein product [Rhizoctonia solani]
MLLNRLFSIVALASVLAPILAAPLPRPDEHETEVKALGWEVEIEKDKHGRIKEIEIENDTLGFELEIEKNKSGAED